MVFTPPVSNPAHSLISLAGGDAMNKADLIEKIAKDVRISKTTAGKTLDSLVDGVTKSLKKGERVALVGFGTFSISKRKARVGRNPQTGETIQIKARRVARFRPGKELAASIK